MKTTHLGNTIVDVSALCFGTMHLGSKIGTEESFNLLDQYYQAGGTFLDTANIYCFWIPGCNGGESESVIGEWMRLRNNRTNLFIASKVGFAYQNVKAGLTANQIETECEKSLQRLKIETIDLLYSHIDDRNTPIEETLKAYEKLRKAGKIIHIGASNYMSWRLADSLALSQMNNLIQYCCIQQRYSYIRPNPGGRFAPQMVANDELINLCRDKNVTLLAYSPFLNGAYTRMDRDFPAQYVGPDTTKRIKVLENIARKMDVTINQLILAWMVNNNPSIIPVMAASTYSQMQENIASLKINLTKELIAKLNDANTGGTAW